MHLSWSVVISLFHIICVSFQLLILRKITNCELKIPLEYLIIQGFGGLRRYVIDYMAWITGIRKIVFGATLKDSIKYGFSEINVTDSYLNKKSGKKVVLERGFLRDECLELFK